MSQKNKANTRVHIVGCGPRTGTTLMAEMMIACFEIDQHADHEASIYTQPPCESDVFLTKHPGEILLVRPMLKLISKLYVIYMVRDPRDTISSKHRKAPDKYWATLRYWKKFTPIGRKLADHPRFITVRYEDLVNNPDEVQAALLKKMPFLKKKGPFSRYHELATPSEGSVAALQGVRPVSSSSIGNWRKHLPRVASQLQVHGAEGIAQDLIEYGYESDDAWLQELEGVTPDTSASYWPEHFSKQDLKTRTKGKYRRAVSAFLADL